MNINRKIALKQLKKLDKLGSLKEMRLAAEKWNKPWKILITTILSARTRDETTIPIAEKLFERYDSLERLANAKIRDIEDIIKPINFYKNKSRNIISSAKILVDKYRGNIPLSFEKLIGLPGVGRKTANVFLSEIGKDAIGIDTHASYISQRLGWTKNKSPAKIENDLKKLFPKKMWKRINPTLVRVGKSYTSKREKDKILDEIKKIR